MEACDDIAYSVLDVDDAMKKGVVSPDDVLSVLSAREDVKEHAAISKLSQQFKKARDAQHRPEISRDIKIGYFRATMLDALVAEASASFERQEKVIMDFGEATPLMDESSLCKALKAVAQQYAFSHPDVLKMEACGAAAIDGLLDRFWSAIDNREDYGDLLSPRKSPVDKYVFALISPNYIESAVRAGLTSGPAASVRYRELRLLTDMVSGMTDSFTIKLWNQLKELDDPPRP